MISSEYDSDQSQNSIFINHKYPLCIGIIVNSYDFKIGLKLQAKAGTADFMNSTQP